MVLGKVLLLVPAILSWSGFSIPLLLLWISPGQEERALVKFVQSLVTRIYTVCVVTAYPTRGHSRSHPRQS